MYAIKLSLTISMPENLWLFRDGLGPIGELSEIQVLYRVVHPRFTNHGISAGIPSREEDCSYSGLTSEFHKYIQASWMGPEGNTKDQGDLEPSVRMNLYQTHLPQCVFQLPVKT